MKRALSLMLVLAAACAGDPRKNPSPQEETPELGKPPRSQAQLGETAPKRPVIKLGQLVSEENERTISKVQAAYFTRVNRMGGVNGSDVNLLSVREAADDAAALAQVQQLVERDHVVAMFNQVGTRPSVLQYLREHKVPLLFASAAVGAPAFDPGDRIQGVTIGRAIQKRTPKPRVAILSEGEAPSAELVAGIKSELKQRDAVVLEASYPAGPLSSVLDRITAARADVVVDVASSERAAELGKAARERGAKFEHFLVPREGLSAAPAAPRERVGGTGLISPIYLKDPADKKRWFKDSDMNAYYDFMDADCQNCDAQDLRSAYGYATAQTMTSLLMRCDRDYSAQNMLTKSEQLEGFTPGMLLPGVVLHTTPERANAAKDSLRLAQFDGKAFALLD